MRRLKVSGGTVYQTNICSLWMNDGTGKGRSLFSDTPDCEGPNDCHTTGGNVSTKDIPRGSVRAVYDTKGRCIGHIGSPSNINYLLGGRIAN